MTDEHFYGPEPPPGIHNEPDQRIIWFDGDRARNPEGWFLSNFCPSPFTLSRQVHERLAHREVTTWADARWAAMENTVFPTGEACFQAFKEMDPHRFLEIGQVKNPHEAKRRGRKCRLRPDWNAVKVDVMREIIAAKFSAQNPALLSALVATRDAVLVEGNTWGDTSWGVPVTSDALGHPQVRWGRGRNDGANLLGLLLQARRAELHLGLHQGPRPQVLSAPERFDQISITDSAWLDLLRERRGMVNFEVTASGDDEAVTWVHCTVEGGLRTHGTTFSPAPAGSRKLREQFAAAGKRMLEAEERHLAGEEPNGMDLDGEPPLSTAQALSWLVEVDGYTRFLSGPPALVHVTVRDPLDATQSVEVLRVVADEVTAGTAFIGAIREAMSQVSAAQAQGRFRFLRAGDRGWRPDGTPGW